MTTPIFSSQRLINKNQLKAKQVLEGSERTRPSETYDTLLRIKTDDEILIDNNELFTWSTFKRRKQVRTKLFICKKLSGYRAERNEKIGTTKFWPKTRQASLTKVIKCESTY